MDTNDSTAKKPAPKGIGRRANLYSLLAEVGLPESAADELSFTEFAVILSQHRRSRS